MAGELTGIFPGYCPGFFDSLQIIPRADKLAPNLKISLEKLWRGAYDPQ
jgi:hypothetical protein